MSVSKLTCELDLSAFECQICFDMIKPPIYICSKGHSSVCTNCLDKTGFTIKCATCQLEVTRVRNFLVEEIVNMMIIKCPNWHCQMDLTYGQFEAHSVSCKKRNVSPVHSNGGAALYYESDESEDEYELPEIVTRYLGLSKRNSEEEKEKRRRRRREERKKRQAEEEERIRKEREKMKEEERRRKVAEAEERRVAAWEAFEAEKRRREREERKKREAEEIEEMRRRREIAAKNRAALEEEEKRRRDIAVSAEAYSRFMKRIKEEEEEQRRAFEVYEENRRAYEAEESRRASEIYEESRRASEAYEENQRAYEESRRASEIYEENRRASEAYEESRRMLKFIRCWFCNCEMDKNFFFRVHMRPCRYAHGNMRNY